MRVKLTDEKKAALLALLRDPSKTKAAESWEKVEKDEGGQEEDGQQEKGEEKAREKAREGDEDDDPRPLGDTGEDPVGRRGAALLGQRGRGVRHRSGGGRGLSAHEVLSLGSAGTGGNLCCACSLSVHLAIRRRPGRSVTSRAVEVASVPG